MLQIPVEITCSMSSYFTFSKTYVVCIFCSLDPFCLKVVSFVSFVNHLLSSLIQISANCLCFFLLNFLKKEIDYICQFHSGDPGWEGRSLALPWGCCELSQSSHLWRAHLWYDVMTALGLKVAFCFTFVSVYFCCYWCVFFGSLCFCRIYYTIRFHISWGRYLAWRFFSFSFTILIRV